MKQHGSSDVVDSLLHPRAVELRQLLDNVQRDARPRSILIDDEENIVQAIAAGIKIERMFFTSDMPISRHLQQRLAPSVPTYELAKRTGKKLFKSGKWSRMFAIAQAPPLQTLADLASMKKDMVVLENLGISGNVGAIIRTAVALGTGSIVLLNSELDIYDRRLIRASRGHVFSLPVIKATTETFLAFCKEHGWQLLVTDVQTTPSAAQIDKLPERLAIAFGNEKKGCSLALREAADFRVRIPIEPIVESLNVSSAAAILLFQRLGKPNEIFYSSSLRRSI